MTRHHPITRPSYRAETATTLCMAIGACNPSDAAQIMAAALEQMATGGPDHDVFGTVRQDAEWWAEIAPAHEVQAYVNAGLRQLLKSAIGPKARKAVIVALWRGMTDQDKAAFLRAVAGD